MWLKALIFGLGFLSAATVLSHDLRVEQDCRAAPNCYRTIAEALSVATELRDRSNNRIVLRVGEGQFREKLRVEVDNIELVGAGPEHTTIIFDDYAGNSSHHHRDGWGTPGSATLTINADDVRVSGFSIENDFDYLANDAREKSDPNKLRDSQAVALLLDVESDRVLFDEVNIYAYQDTVFTNGGRAYIRNSRIAGNVDFIFGNGALLIENSDVISRPRGKPMPVGKPQSYITAASTQLSQPYGITIAHSRLLKAEGVPKHSVSLGRPWHPTTDFEDGRYADPNAVAQVSFISCFMDDHILPAAWGSMSGTARDGTKSLIFGPEDSRYFEVASTGPGANRESQAIAWDKQPKLDDIRAFMFSGWTIEQ
jgi:pectinesterase